MFLLFCDDTHEMHKQAEKKVKTLYEERIFIFLHITLASDTVPKTQIKIILGKTQELISVLLSHYSSPVSAFTPFSRELKNLFKALQFLLSNEGFRNYENDAKLEIIFFGF